MKYSVKKKGKSTIFRKWITRNGKRIYASQYGLKAFRFEVDTIK